MNEEGWQQRGLNSETPARQHAAACCEFSSWRISAALLVEWYSTIVDTAWLGKPLCSGRPSPRARNTSASRRPTRCAASTLRPPGEAGPHCGRGSVPGAAAYYVEGQVEGAFGSGQRGGGLQLGLDLLLVAAQLAVQSSLPPASPNGPPPAHRCFRCKQVEERVQGFPPDFPQVAFLKVDLEETEVGRDA